MEKFRFLGVVFILCNCVFIGQSGEVTSSRLKIGDFRYFIKDEPVHHDVLKSSSKPVLEASEKTGKIKIEHNNEKKALYLNLNSNQDQGSLEKHLSSEVLDNNHELYNINAVKLYVPNYHHRQDSHINPHRIYKRSVKKTHNNHNQNTHPHVNNNHHKHEEKTNHKETHQNHSSSRNTSTKAHEVHNTHPSKDHSHKEKSDGRRQESVTATTESSSSSSHNHTGLHLQNDFLIGAPVRPCPSGEKRDWRGLCRTAM